MLSAILLLLVLHPRDGARGIRTVRVAQSGNGRAAPTESRAHWVDAFVARYRPAGVRSADSARCEKIVAAARSLVRDSIEYDPAYFAIPYPNGDVPPDKGVCADVIVRSLRAGGLDLQQAVAEDLLARSAHYPQLWGSRKPDHNIDHRRVPDLMIWFQRHGASLPLSHAPSDYANCDLVAWDLGGGVTHIGLVSDAARGLVVHHIGGHPTEEKVLFDWRIIGHFALKD